MVILFLKQSHFVLLITDVLDFKVSCSSIMPSAFLIQCIKFCSKFFKWIPVKLDNFLILIFLFLILEILVFMNFWLFQKRITLIFKQLNPLLLFYAFCTLFIIFFVKVFICIWIIFHIFIKVYELSFIDALVKFFLVRILVTYFHFLLWLIIIKITFILFYFFLKIFFDKTNVFLN